MRLAILSLLISLVCSACEGPVGPVGPEGPQGEQGEPGDTGDDGEPGSFDKQVRVVLYDGESSHQTSSSTGQFVDEVLKFNVGYYPGVDSVVFVAKMWTTDPSNAAVAELRDSTNDVVLTSIETSNHFNIVVESGNILDRFPEEEITLSVWIRTNSPTSFETTRLEKAFLFLYRD